VRTQAHTLSSLDAANRIKTSTQPSKCADRCTDTLSSRGASARRRKLNEDTRSALETCKLTLSSRDGIRSAHGDTRSALETCQQMLSSRATYADKRSAQDASQLVQIHTHVPIWASNMQLTAQLLIQAGACRNMPSLKYVHTHAGLQYVHVHAWF
jgi:hypothetical protein